VQHITLLTGIPAKDTVTAEVYYPSALLFVVLNNGKTVQGYAIVDVPNGGAARLVKGRRMDIFLSKPVTGQDS
jgi:hypothetical protein